MKCPRCQAENREGARFCRECGATFGAVCSGCGTKVEPGSKFCDSCGASLEATPAPPTARRFASPESYTPKHLAEKILTSKAALEGERKQVTVLFADLKGSMELLADRDPEEARKLLDPVLEHMMEAVHWYEGTVNQVMGDGIMALFGAPLAHEDHAVRACYAALRMQETVKRYAEGVRRTEGVLIQIRVGLNSGEVVVRSIGSDLHMDYTAVGQTTHLAARMEQLAAPGSVLVTAGTLHLAEGYVRVKPLGPMAVKGLGEPVDTYELTGIGPARSRLHAAVARGLSRFVGRDPEMEQLRRLLEQARQGRGQVVAVVGEPGVGKSRLVFEFTHSHRLAGWLILESGSVSYGKATSYLPVIDLLKAYFKIHDRDTHRDIREKATGKILTLDRTLEPVLPALLALLDVPVDDPQWQAADPPTRRQRTLGGLKQLLLRESQAQPLLLVFEDLHWIDSETQALLDSLVDSLPTARLLLLVNYRPEYHHAWSSKTYYTQLRLDTLPPESTDELLQALVGHDPSLEPLKALLPVRTGGNPLFIEESVRALVETGALVGDRGAYRLARPLEAAQVPATVQAILAARIDRLPPEEKQLLQTAAVIGKDVPFALLQAVADETDEALRSRLAHLQAAEFLYEQSLFPDLEYTFKHALTHEVAYGSLLHERRRALHAGIVEAVERIYAGRLDEQVERLAQHAARGEVWGKAVAYARQAGARASLRNAFSQAVRFFEEALAALAHLPASHETLALSVDLTLDLRGTLSALGEVDRTLECTRRALSLAESLGDEDRLARATAAMTFALYFAGDAHGAVLWGERALASAEARGDVSQQIQARFNVGQASQAVGDYRRGIELLERNVEVLGGDPTSRRPGSYALPGVLSRAWLAWCLAPVGEFARAIQVAEEGARLVPALDTPFNSLAACWGLGVSPIFRGNHESAIPVLERGLALSRESSAAIWTPPFGAFLGYAYTRGGQLSKGLALLEEAVTRAETLNRVGQAHWLSLLSEALLLAGRQEDALAAARRGLDGARGRHERGCEAMNLRALAEVAAHADPPDSQTADRHYREALALATELGMRPLVARCHAGLATLSGRTGQRAEVDKHAATATALYREMGMTYWLEKLEREMRKTP